MASQFTHTRWGIPTAHAAIPGDVFVGDMGEVHNLVRATDHHGIHHLLWVTEFAWFTNPPNAPLGDPNATAARYVAYSMYEMWKAGVSLVAWQDLTDLPPTSSDTGRGLYTTSGQPKLTLQAFAFPVVASVRRGHGFVWGRAPVSHPVHVVVQHSVGNRWRTMAKIRTGGEGVFHLSFRARRNGFYRAQVVRGPTSLTYNSTPIPPKYTRPVNFG